MEARRVNARDLVLEGTPGRIREVAAFTVAVDGWLLDQEGPYLFWLASGLRGRGVIVEIGSYQGKSTIWLAAGSASRNAVPVYAVDHHLGSEEHRRDPGFVPTWERFLENIARSGYGDKIVPIRTSSDVAADAWSEPVELLFIDGGHDEKDVELDLAAWLPHVIPGGVVAFHDSNGDWPGVWRSVKRHVYFGTRFRAIRWCQSITAATLVEQQSAADVLANRLAFIRRKVQRTNVRRPSLRPRMW